MSFLSVVIPSKNGMELLRQYLPDIIRETAGARGELIVVDDCSTDSTVKMMKEEFPEVMLLKLSGQSAFCRAVNYGMREASGDCLMLLNNDTIPEKGSFIRLLNALEESSDMVAVVVPSIPRPDGTDDSLYRWRFRMGLAATSQSSRGHPYPSGACALWKKKAWEALGGLDCRYAPIYWEDTDLGARMEEAGYTMQRLPEAVVNHVHGATMGHSSETLVLRERNRFIFMDTNCSSFFEKLQTVFWLPLHIVVALLRSNSSFISGYRAWKEWRKNR